MQNTTTTTTPASRTTVLSADRICRGRPTTTEIVTSYTPDPPFLPILVVLDQWSPKAFDYRRKSAFRCEEVPTPSGRGFMLHRPAADVAKDGPDADTFYGVLVAHSPLDHTCTCRGFQAHGHCRHFDAVRALLLAGYIDAPADSAPAGLPAASHTAA